MKAAIKSLEQNTFRIMQHHDDVERQGICRSKVKSVVYYYINIKSSEQTNRTKRTKGLKTRTPRQQVKNMPRTHTQRTNQSWVSWATIEMNNVTVISEIVICTKMPCWKFTRPACFHFVYDRTIEGGSMEGGDGSHVLPEWSCAVFDSWRLCLRVKCFSPSHCEASPLQLSHTSRPPSQLIKLEQKWMLRDEP